MVSGRRPPTGTRGLGLRADAATGATLVHVGLDAEHRARSEDAVVELLGSLMARYAVRRLLDSLPQRATAGPAAPS